VLNFIWGDHPDIDVGRHRAAEADHGTFRPRPHPAQRVRDEIAQRCGL